MKRITIQGEAGCFHDATAHEYFAGEDIETIACPSFREMFDMLHADSNLIGTLAIENTIAGSLLQNHELRRGSAPPSWASTRCTSRRASPHCPGKS